LRHGKNILKEICKGGLILPGGESTTMALIAEQTGLLEPLRDLVQNSKIPIWGTCAGMILLSNQASNTKQGGQMLLGGLDIKIKRNAFGRQMNSFVAPLVIPDIEDGSSKAFEGVFIRAPAIEEIPAQSADTIKVFARLPQDKGGFIVGVVSGRILATAFHPELTMDTRVHKYFISMAQSYSSESK
jgi:5'-phosphate synthase pdxT subunit